MDTSGMTDLVDENEDEMGYGQMEGEFEEHEIDENGEYAQFSFPSFSPTSRKRVRLRKPNFSEECLELLIQLVNEHRDILYTKQAYTNEVHEKKIMVWTHITSKINAISSIPRTLEEASNQDRKHMIKKVWAHITSQINAISPVQRTMEEVRKKWNDYSYYVKKKRENEKRGVHYNPITESLDNGLDEYHDIPRTGKRDHYKIREREDRVLVIVDNAHREAAMTAVGETVNNSNANSGTTSSSNNANDNISSLLLDACQRARQEANYEPGKEGVNDVEADESETASRSNSPGPVVYKNPVGRPPGSRRNQSGIPPLPSPISNYSFKVDYKGGHSSSHDVRRSGRVRTPVKTVYTPSTRGRGRGRGRGAALAVANDLSSGRGGGRGMLAVYSATGAEEDIIQVNKQRLAIERRRLNVEKQRLRIEQRRLEIEEERFRWEKMARGINSPVPGLEDDEDDDEETVDGEEGENETTTENEASATEQYENVNSVVAVSETIGQPGTIHIPGSPVKYETQSPDPLQPQIALPIATDSSSIMPVDAIF